MFPRFQKSLRRMLVSINFIGSRMVAWGSTNSYFLSLRGGRKKGEGEGRGRKARKRGKGKGAYPLSTIPLPFSLPPYPLPLSTPATRATIFLEGKTRAEKSVCSPPRKAAGWGIQEEVCCNWQNAFKKSV